MSTLCKLDPEVRRNRAARATLMRYFGSPKASRVTEKHQVKTLMVARSLCFAAYKAPHLTGAEKQRIFVYASAQLKKARL